MNDILSQLIGTSLFFDAGRSPTVLFLPNTNFWHLLSQGVDNLVFLKMKGKLSILFGQPVQKLQVSLQKHNYANNT